MLSQYLGISFSFLISAILLIAAIGKSTDLSGSRKSLDAFGFRSSATLLMLFVPFLEATLAIMLLTGIFVRFAAISTAAVFTGFAIIITRSVFRGDSHDCNCFGALLKSPVSWVLVWRNGILAIMALIVAAEPTTDLRGQWNNWSWAWFSSHVSYILLILLIVSIVEAAVLISVLRKLRKTTLSAGAKLSKLSIGVRLPDIDISDLDGTSKTLTHVLAGSSQTLLIFMSPGCSSCARILPKVVQWQRNSTKLNIIILGRGLLEANRKYANTYELLNMYVAHDSAFSSLGIVMTPAAALITGDRALAAEVMNGPDAIASFFASSNDVSMMVTAPIYEQFHEVSEQRAR